MISNITSEELFPERALSVLQLAFDEDSELIERNKRKLPDRLRTERFLEKNTNSR